MSDVTFTFAPNKYPGACHFCARRVRANDGACWLEESTGRFAVGHSACITSAIARNAGPRVGQKRIGGAAADAGRVEAGLAPGARTASATLRALRDAIRPVMVTSPEAEIVAALEQARRVLSAPIDAVAEEAPF